MEWCRRGSPDYRDDFLETGFPLRRPDAFKPKQDELRGYRFVEFKLHLAGSTARLKMPFILRLFKRKPKKFLSPSAELFDSMVGEGAEVHGRLVIHKSIRIDGAVYGSIEIPEGEKNITVAIGINGKVFGDIKAYRVLVAGSVEGKIYATERVELLGQASVKGDITYNDIGIEPGAQLVGFVMKRVGKKNEVADAEILIRKISKLEIK